MPNATLKAAALCYSQGAAAAARAVGESRGAGGGSGGGADLGGLVAGGRGVVGRGRDEDGLGGGVGDGAEAGGGGGGEGVGLDRHDAPLVRLHHGKAPPRRHVPLHTSTATSTRTRSRRPTRARQSSPESPSLTGPHRPVPALDPIPPKYPALVCGLQAAQ